MLRTLAVALGLAVVASTVVAEEFVVIINDQFTESGVTTGVTSVPDEPTVQITTSADERAMIARARGEDGTYLNITPFN